MLMNHTAAFAAYKPVETATTIPAQQTALPLMISGTKVETETGWMPVERLSLGDSIYTFDGGAVPVAGLTQTRLTAGTRLLHLPAGTLNNCDDMYLAEDQHVMVYDSAAEDLFDTPYVLVPATALQGFRGTRQVDAIPGTVAVELTFDAPEIVFANTGTLVCCGSQDMAKDDFFRTLTNAESRILLAMLNTPQADRLPPLAA